MLKKSHSTKTTFSQLNTHLNFYFILQCKFSLWLVSQCYLPWQFVATNFPVLHEGSLKFYARNLWEEKFQIFIQIMVLNPLNLFEYNFCFFYGNFFVCRWLYYVHQNITLLACDGLPKIVPLEVRSCKLMPSQTPFPNSDIGKPWFVVIFLCSMHFIFIKSTSKEKKILCYQKKKDTSFVILTWGSIQ